MSNLPHGITLPNGLRARVVPLPNGADLSAGGWIEADGYWGRSPEGAYCLSLARSAASPGGARGASFAVLGADQGLPLGAALQQHRLRAALSRWMSLVRSRTGPSLGSDAPDRVAREDEEIAALAREIDTAPGEIGAGVRAARDRWLEEFISAAQADAALTRSHTTRDRIARANKVLAYFGAATPRPAATAPAPSGPVEPPKAAEMTPAQRAAARAALMRDLA